MKKYLEKLMGDPNEKLLKTIWPTVDKINSLEETIQAKSDSELKAMTGQFRERLGVKKTAEGKLDISALRQLEEEMVQQKLNDILPEAFAVVREAARRILGQRHFDVQLVGGIVLHRGEIGEMKTGEGKTLVATLPLYLNALTGRGAQLITVNDYLSRVGAGWMGPVFHALGLSTGVIVADASYVYDPEYTDETQYDPRLRHFRRVERKEAYQCDVLYGTNNEFGFDYLRDSMVPDLDRMVQRDLNYAIVDEIDSILIDEARTPLIISAPAEESTDKYYKFADLVRRLKENEDYNVDEKMRATTLSESGIAKMEKWLGVDNIYTSGGVREVHHIEQALKAHALFKRDRDYVVKDGEVVIVDEFTGRLMHGRRYSEGLHQAIEAKEGVKIQRESQTLATITFQNYFRMYNKLAGMTGTAATEAEEFAKIYGLNTVVIPTHRPMVRKDHNDLIYRTEEGKFKAVIAEVKKRQEKGQPVLVGTISVEKNEKLSQMMEREGLRPEVLNAKNHLREAQIIADAGRAGSVTISTNMAGRGVDIMLGGAEPDDKDSPEYEEWKREHEKVKELGGLHVIGTERHESRRIDNQLRGRSGRQGDPGSSQFYVSTEDDLMRIFGGDRMKNMMQTLRVPEDMPIDNKMISRSIESAQRRVEGNNFDVRKHLVEYDDVLNKHREAIYRQRREVLEVAKAQEKYREGERSEEPERKLSDIVFEMIEAEIEQVVSYHTSADEVKNWDLTEIYQVVSTIFPVNEQLKEDLAGYTEDGNKLDKAKARTSIIEHLTKLAREKYAELEKAAESAGYTWPQIEKAVLIRSIDTLWVEHLEAISSMRQGIGLRGYGQRDPLIEYKKEAYRLFNELTNLIQKECVYSIYKIAVAEGRETEPIQAPSLADRAKQFSAPSKTSSSNTSSFSGFKPAGRQGNASGGQTAETVKQKAKTEDGQKVGRNDPCPCGSGKKYKKCCGS